MMEYVNAFLCGGLLCAVGQIILDKTALTPARILTGYVVAGVLLQAVGVYQYVVDWGGAAPKKRHLIHGDDPVSTGVVEGGISEPWPLTTIKRGT